LGEVGLRTSHSMTASLIAEGMCGHSMTVTLPPYYVCIVCSYLLVTH
jgi:hypothetical protein